MIEETQKAICRKYGAAYLASPPNLKVGISRNVGNGVWPINGLRHPPEGDTTGWYILAGLEMSSAPDFFLPLHVSHLHRRCPKIQNYLGLAPGWRFLFDETYEDIWFDEALLTLD